MIRYVAAGGNSLHWLSVTQILVWLRNRYGLASLQTPSPSDESHIISRTMHRLRQTCSPHHGGHWSNYHHTQCPHGPRPSGIIRLVWCATRRRYAARPSPLCADGAKSKDACHMLRLHCPDGPRISSPSMSSISVLGELWG
jgi:hypothetical protein